MDGGERALVAFVQDPDGGQGPTAAVDLLSDTLLSHLSYEERELVEPLARLGFFRDEPPHRPTNRPPVKRIQALPVPADDAVLRTVSDCY